MIIVFDKPTALNPTGSSSPDYVPLIPPRAHASHLFPFTLPRPSHGGQSPAGLRFLASMSNAGSQPLHLGFVQLGNLLEAERTILPPPRCVCRCFPGWWHLWKTCLYLHLVGCWWKAEHGGLWCPGGVSVPGGLWPGLCAVGCPKAGLHCEREPCAGKVSGETSSVPGSSLTHGRCCWQSCGVPGCWPTGAGGAGLVARVVWECGGRRAQLVGTSARPGTALGGWSGVLSCERAGCGALCSCSPGRYRHPRRVMGWTLITAVCRLLCGGDTPLLARVILDGGKITSEFCLSSPVLWCSPAQDKAAPGSLCLSLSLGL